MNCTAVGPSCASPSTSPTGLLLLLLLLLSLVVVVVDESGMDVFPKYRTLMM